MLVKLFSSGLEKKLVWVLSQSSLKATLCGGLISDFWVELSWGHKEDIGGEYLAFWTQKVVVFPRGSNYPVVRGENDNRG